MSKFDQLNDKELTDLIDKATLEARYRDTVVKAKKEILAVLKKNKLTIKDLSLMNFDERKPQSTTKTTKKAGKLKRTPAKRVYFKPGGKENWSGRGRSPAWVKQICDDEGISIQQFKAERKFQR